MYKLLSQRSVLQYLFCTFEIEQYNYCEFNVIFITNMSFAISKSYYVFMK